LFVYLYQINYLPLSAAAADSSITLSLIFPFAAIAYLLWRGNNPKSIIAKLGLKKKGLTVRTILLGILLFLAMLFTEMLLGLFQELTHIPLPTNVQALFAGLPLYFLVFAAFIAPFDEEVFFRGLLVPQIGIILSAFFFALLHYLSYLSISEFIISFVFGLLAGYTFKRTDSIYPSIIAHVLVNSMAVITLLYSMLIIV
jgi:membrane protease YdiL (CAAX protease family)